MSKEQGKSRKPLIIGIVAAVVILAALLAVLLTQCKTQEPAQTETTTVPATTAPVQQVVEEYDLYWNMDRALYDGKSEAGMSSRMPEEDGFFHVRFFHDGEVVTLRVADRKTVNALEVKDLMGLVFDENGIVVGILDIKELPCEMVAWQFYVQSAGGNLIKTNSSASLNGMEVMLETNADTGVWDMTGLSGDVGCDATPIGYDRILAVADQSGKLTHVFIYERSNYMRTHEAECEHCGKVVEWSEWTKTDKAPSITGHYQLTTDIQLPSNGTQISLAEDQKICLDLNGHRIDGTKDRRVYSLHNVGTEMAIMDTSEAGNGRIAAHGKGDQGMCVWLRYGVVYLYGGILDGSDATSIKNGCTVRLQANTYMYMHGGEIIGGTATYLKQDNGKYTNGLGGSLYVAGKGKFVMNDGVIRDGYAEAIVTKRDTKGEPATYERGYGGNIFLSSGSVFEMNGGTIKNGKADNAGGNIHMDGTAEFVMNNGTISGGTLTGKGKNGGSIYVSSKSVFTMNNGTITGGSSRNCAGNLYLNGTVTMNGGYIGGGKIRTWGTGKINTSSASRNVFIVNGNFAMYGGTIDGGVQAIDTNAASKETVVVLSGFATINAKSGGNLTISTGGSGVKVIVGALQDSAKIGVNTSAGLFTQPTKETNLDSFYSELAGADIIYYDGRIGLGRVGCLCGGEGEGHLAGCDGKELFWGPWTSKETLPTTTGNYYLLNDVTCGQQNVAADAVINLDLNGKEVNNKGGRIYSMHYRVETVTGTGEDKKTTYSYPAHLTITDTSEGRKGTMKAVGVANHQGGIAWLRYGNVTLLAGTFDASGYEVYGNWNVGKDGLYGTSDDQITTISGGAFSVPGGRTLTIYGGTIIGGKTIAQEQTKTNTIPVPEGAPEGTEPTTEEVTKVVAAGNGGALDVSGTVYMYGGTIRDGISGATAGNVRINGGGKFYMYGGQILNGTSTGNGGSIQLSGLLELHGGLISGGWSKNVGGNLHVSPGTLTMYGGTITGGKTGAAGTMTSDFANIYVVNGKWNLHGGTVEGYARVINYNVNGSEKGSVMTISGNPVVAGGNVNLVLAPQRDKTDFNPTMPVVQVVGKMTEGANIQVNQATVDMDFAAGNGYTVTDADGKYFSINGLNTCAVADTEKNTLFFGRFGCLCGKDEHTFGCQQVNGGKDLKWRAWQSATTLPTSGNWYLIRTTNTNGSTTVARDATLTLDLNGQTINSTYRTYRIFDASAVANATLTITNTADTEGTIRANQWTGVDQGCAVWVASGEKGVFNLLEGVVLDGSKYTVKNVPSESNGAGSTTEKNGGVVAIQSGGVFNMYGGKIIGATAVRSEEITLSNGNKYSSYAPNGAALALASATCYMYGGEITGGSTENQGGNVLLNGEMFMYGGVISNGHAGATAGNVFVHRNGKLHMSGDARIENGTSAKYAGSILVDGIMTMTDNAVVTGGEAKSGTSGNICVNFMTTGGVTYYGKLTMSGNSSVTGGKTSSQGGNITVLKGATMTMEGNAVVSGGEALTASGSGGNIFVSGAGAKLTITDNATVSGGKTTYYGGNIYVYNGAEAQIIGKATITGGTVLGNGTGTEPTGGNIAIDTGKAAVILGGSAKIIDGISYHTGGNVRVSTDCIFTIQENAVVSGGRITNGKGNRSETPSESHSNANIFCVNGTMNFNGGKVTGNIQAIATKANGTTIKFSGNPVITQGVSGSGLLLTGNGSIAPVPAQIVGAMTGEPGSVVIGTSLTSGVVAVGTNYTITTEDAAVFTADKKATAAGCFVLQDGNQLVVGKGDCLCGKEEHTKACKELWNGEDRIWSAWTSTTTLPTTSGNYYLTGNVDFDWQQKIAKNANIVLDLNGYTISNDNGQRMYTTWESGGSLTITDKSEAQTGKLVGSGNAVDQGLIWVRYGTFNLVGGTIDASGYNLSCVWNASQNKVDEKNGCAIWVNSGTTFNMYGGTVIGGNGVKSTTTVDGVQKSVYAPNGATISSYGTSNIYDGIIRDGRTESEGGNVYVASGTFTMFGGQVLNGRAVNGGNFRIHADGTVILKEGAIVSGGEATTGPGGNFKVQGKLIIEGATVTDSVCGHNGGNIYISGSGQVTLNSGVVSNGWGKNVSGNFHVDGGKLVVNGGEIKGGKVGASGNANASDANINNINGKVEFNGGSVAGGIQIFNYDVNQTIYPTVKISGDAQLDGFLNLTRTSGKALPQLEIDESFTGSLKVYVPEDGIITTKAVTAEQAAKITTTNANKKIYQITAEMGFPAEDVGKLYIGQIHCVCGASENGGEHYADICDGTLHVWKPTASVVDSDNKGAEQYYYLTGNVTVTANTTLTDSAHKVTYDLNGFNVTINSGRMFTTYKSGNDSNALTVTLTNTSTKTSTIDINGKGDEGRLMWQHGTKKTLNIYNITIDAKDAFITSETVSKHGVVICAAGWSNVTNLYRVTGIGGTSNSNGNFLAVSGKLNQAVVKDSSITGSVTNNLGGNGGAVWVNTEAQLTLDNATITGNSALKNGGGVYVVAKAKLIISGDTTITGNVVGNTTNNVYMEEGAILETGTLGSKAKVGLAGVVGKVLSTDVTYAEMEAAFVSDSNAYQLVRTAEGMSLQDATAHIHCRCGGTIANGTKLPDGTTHICEDIVYTPMPTGFTTSNIGGNQNWYLPDDVILTGQVSTQNYVLNLCMNGHSMTTSYTGRMLRTYCSTASTTDDNRIVLTSCVADTVVDGKVTNNRIYQKNVTASDNGDGGIFWITSSGVVEMYAGCLDASMYTLKPNSSDSPKHGCALLVEVGSSFKMYGGTIYGGKTLRGTSNNSEGATIFLSNTGSMIMNGGTIVGGETVGSGGAIFGYGGSLKIYGGTIKNGVALNNGGNIFMQNYKDKNGNVIPSSLLIAGGTITGGTTKTISGGNICCKGVSVEITGGTIENGTAKKSGGNIYAETSNGQGSLKMSGGTITKGTSQDENGGNIYIYGMTVDLSNTTITSGACTGRGGNLFLDATTVNMTSGIITNGATFRADGSKDYYNANANLLVGSNATLNISGGEVHGSINGYKTGAMNISGDAVVVRAYPNLSGNNIWVGDLTVNIGDLNEGAAVGFIQTFAYTSERVLATYTGTKPLDLSKIGVFMYGDKDNGKKFAIELTADKKIVVREVK